ncbi:MAG: terminase large subunit domain-containing protein [Nitrososphaera sp.]
MQVFECKKRFKSLRTGRRFGKTHLAAVTLLVEGLKSKNDFGYDLAGKGVFYIAPTKDQARDVMWGLLRRLGQGVIESAHENTMVARLVNGRIIHLKGSDRPDSLRGVGLSYAIMDEYATMRPEVWELIIRPTLADVRGGALFIGTPDGRNHADLLHQMAGSAKHADEWAAFQFRSSDNPYLAPEEIEAARKVLAHAAFRQEFEGIPTTGGGSLFNPDDLLVVSQGPDEGDYVLAIDLAGFAGVAAAAKLSHELRRLDEHAIACVKVHPAGWYVDDIIHGRWDPRETSVRILRAIQMYRPSAVGIEKGVLKNAVMPYLTDQMRRLGVYAHISEVTHGGKSKTDRITWALSGRLEHGRIKFREGPYLRTLKDQMEDFPNSTAHDDLLDALAYVDQVSVTVYTENAVVDTWSPLDVTSGY